jgi:hypothetical protein
MAIDDATSVDALGIDPETGQPLLIISDHLDWSDVAGHINALQQKVTAYMAFVHGGQLDAALPEGVGRRRKIGVIQQYEPPPVAIQLLDQIGQQLSAFNVDFGYGPLPDGYDTQA